MLTINTVTIYCSIYCITDFRLYFVSILYLLDKFIIKHIYFNELTSRNLCFYFTLTFGKTQLLILNMYCFIHLCDPFIDSNVFMFHGYVVHVCFINTNYFRSVAGFGACIYIFACYE